MSTGMVLRFKRDELIDALEERRGWAEHFDAVKFDEHQKAEKAYLAEFKRQCREAVKWDYETAKANHFNVDGQSWSRSYPPSCPASVVAKLDRVLNVVRASRQQTFVVSDSGIWSEVFFVLTHDETIKAEMC